MSHLTSLALFLLLLLQGSEGYRVRKRINISERRKPGLKAVPKAVGLEKQKSARFLNPFSLFHVVQFPNTDCVTSGGSQGTCYTSSECLSRGGTSDGGCASGFGVCCSFVNECDSNTSQNGTYFISPSTVPSVCSLMITPLNNQICQVRVEFESLSLVEPDEKGLCTTEYVQVTGGVTGTSVPTLCGTLDGQHVIYTPITNFPARLSVVLSTDTGASSSRSWRVKVLQYSCDSPVLAPEGCLQYYTGISGNVSSFNFKTGDNTNPDNANNDWPNHISNLNYNICLRRESGYCAVEWSTGAPYDEIGLFSLSGDATALSGNTQASDAITGDALCQDDFVMIPQGGDGTNPANLKKDRFCGQALGFCADDTCSANTLGAVSSSVLPFTLGVVTNADETNDMANKGFNLNYRQQPCA